MTARFSPGMRAFVGAYGLLWKGARPLLRRHKRLCDDFAERLVPASWELPEPVDVWIQAASGGEAYLARQLLVEVGDLERTGRFLCTSCTRQGLETLRSPMPTPFPVATRVFPLDDPACMLRALESARPRLMVLLETELWPGLMAACAAHNVPIVVLNGRMTEKSLKGYRLLGSFWRTVSPRCVLATSEQDAERFAALFGRECVSLMPNMKFDAVAPGSAATSGKGAQAVAALLPPSFPVILLASVREQEEALLAEAITLLKSNAPEAVIVVAPRHMEREDAWRARLQTVKAEGRVLLRTAALQNGEVAAGGDVLLWNAFGELRDLYHRADAVFVGGSLVPLGGQNFLEAALAGAVPCVGPHWSNFTWVGKAFFDEGLGVCVDTVEELVAALLAQLAAPRARAARQAGAAAYVAPRRGGTRRAATLVAEIAVLPN